MLGESYLCFNSEGWLTDAPKHPAMSFLVKAEGLLLTAVNSEQRVPFPKASRGPVQPEKVLSCLSTKRPEELQTTGQQWVSSSNYLDNF